MIDAKPADIDAYLAAAPAEARATLSQLRRQIRAIAPYAVESISYGVPTFKYKGRPLAYFAAAKNHCSLYGISVDEFADELQGYDAEKGTVRFPHDKPLPEALVRTLIGARLEAIEAVTARKRTQPPSKR